MAATFPQKFGNYTLIRKLALGGMAELFVAKSVGAEGFEHECVIKRILPSFSEDESFVKMFIDEASLTSKLQHPNIVQIFDFDVTDRQYYIAMEFVEGEDLQNIVKDGVAAGRPLSIAQAVWIMIELAKGLHYAHTKEHKGRPLNIIHRDISPHNAMVSYSGEVKLMDFGIAKAAERSTKTQAGTVKGKVAYMSPEQARGKPLDPRSDLFGLAAVAWELLTGKRLFLRASDFETLTAVLKEDAEPPSKHRKGIDQELDDIIMTALEKDRENRQATVEVFARELTRWYYKHVTDLDKESLRGFMQAIYAPKLAKMGKDPQEVATVRGKPEGSGVEVRNSALQRKSSPVPLPEPAPSPDRDRGADRAGAARRPSSPGESAAGAKRPPATLRIEESRAPLTLEQKAAARTVEAQVPDLLRAQAPLRARPPGPKTGEVPTAALGSPDFANSATILEDGGLGQAEVMKALAEAKRKKEATASAAAQSAGRPGTAQARVVRPIEPKKKSSLLMWVLIGVVVTGGTIVGVLLAGGK